MQGDGSIMLLDRVLVPLCWADIIRTYSLYCFPSLSHLILTRTLGINTIIISGLHGYLVVSQNLRSNSLVFLPELLPRRPSCLNIDDEAAFEDERITLTLHFSACFPNKQNISRAPFSFFLLSYFYFSCLFSFFSFAVDLGFNIISVPLKKSGMDKLGYSMSG